MWLKIFALIATPFKSRRRGLFPVRYIRPQLEPLEQKIAPAVYYWNPLNPNVDSNFSTAANWTDLGGTRYATAPNFLADVSFGTEIQGQVNQAGSTIDNQFQPGLIPTVRSVSFAVGYTGVMTLQESLTTASTQMFGGTIAGAFNYIVPRQGNFLWNSGTLSLTSLVIQSQATLEIPEDVTLTGTIQNSGTISLNNAGGITIQFGNGTLNNSGQVNVTAGNSYTFAGTGSFNNSYQLQVNNNSVLNLTGPSTVLSGSGVINFPQNGGNVVFSAPVTFNGGTQVLGAGHVDISATDMIVNNGTVTVKQATLAPEFGAAVTVNGMLNFLNGATFSLGVTTLDGSGSIGVEQDAYLEVTNILTINNVTLYNYGSATVLSDIAIMNTGTFENAGELEFESNVDIEISGTGFFINYNEILKSESNKLKISCAFQNFAVLILDSGSIELTKDWTNSAALDLNGGAFQVDGAFTNSGVIAVNASLDVFANSVTNNGTINLSWYTLNILPIPGAGSGGNYTQGSSGILKLQISGQNPNTSGELGIGGSATLGGILRIDLASGYQPNGQNPLTWTILNYSSVSGQFAFIWPPPHFTPNSPAQTSLTVTWTP